MFEKYGLEKLYPDGDGPMVVVGLSGGVDSSVSAAILKWQGYRVVGLFMKNWEEEGDAGFCTAEADFNDVKRVAGHIGIPYYSVNFSRQYMDNVFAEFLRGLELGYTPNPDILCNREIKFGPFLDYAKKIGAEFIATGHYCRTRHDDEGVKLLRGVDSTKDQSYFLCGLSQQQLSRAMFPVGGLLKKQVREIATALGLSNANKKDSTGICFIGERKFRDFLKNYAHNKGGDIKTLDGRVVGRHEGLLYYTIGQRKGLGIGGRKDADDCNRWFVVRKDLTNNVLVVNNGECPEMFTSVLTANDPNWICTTPKQGQSFRCVAKTRYRQPDQACNVVVGATSAEVVFDVPQRAVTPGQWVVFYDGEVCLGGASVTLDPVR